MKQIVQLYIVFYTLPLSLTYDETKLRGVADCQTFMDFDVLFAHCVQYDVVKLWHMFPFNTAGVEAHLIQAMRKYQNTFYRYDMVKQTSIYFKSCFPTVF